MPALFATSQVAHICPQLANVGNIRNQPQSYTATVFRIAISIAGG